MKCYFESLIIMVNVKPNKAVDKKKIDGTIAMIQALGMYLRTPHYTNEILTI